MSPDPRPVRHILTGPPGAGKTVLARELELAGFTIVEEAATDVISSAQAMGEHEPWTDAGFCDQILALQLTRERAAPAGTVVFDRSSVCTLALAHFLGRTPSSALIAAASAARETYSHQVFFIESLDFIVNTAARRISLEDALRFGALHRRVYTDLGFSLIDIPPASPVERRDLIISHLR